jgi:hemerythrin-like domain-containing protein
MKATQQLRDEHEGIKSMLSILEQVCQQLGSTGSLNREHFEGILEFLKVFVDKCHHGKEEDLLFPALIALGVPEEGPIAAMLLEHEMGRHFVKAMSAVFARYIAGEESSAKDIIKDAYGYISLMKGHIEKENVVLFVIADSHLSNKRQRELSEGFEKIEEERIGIGKHEEFHALLKKLSRIYK